MSFESNFQELLKQRDFQKAQKLIDDQIQEPTLKAFQTGRLLLEQKDYVKALDLLRPHVGDGTKSGPSILRLYATLHMANNDCKSAERYLQKAVDLAPDDYGTLKQLSNCQLDLAKFDDALALAEHMLSRDPEDLHFSLAKAASLKGLMRPIDSLDEVHRILKIHKNNLVALRIQADIVADSDSKLGLKLYQQVLSLSRKSQVDFSEPQLKWNMCLHQLRARNFSEGWESWELGFHRDVGTMGRRIPEQLKTFTRANLLGPDTDSWTLICPEQGVGDQILFLSTLNELSKTHKKIVFPAEARMLPVLRRAFPQVNFCKPGMLNLLEKLPVHFNGWIPLGSILEPYRQNVNDFARNRQTYLIADGDKVGAFREKLTKMASGRPIIGLSWKGGYWGLQKANKTVTLADWGPILQKDALFVSLQYGDVASDLAKLEDQGIQVVNFNHFDFTRDLDDWLALACACDGIISVSTALVHFAGAVGQKVAVMMPEPQGPWILGTDDIDHLVYPNVKIFRRGVDEDDVSLIKRVAGVIAT